MGSRSFPYNQEIADRICEQIATTTNGLRKICAPEDMPDVSTLFSWIDKHENFAQQYARAKQRQMDMMAEEIIDISDDSTNDVLFVDEYGNKVENKEFVNRSKLKIDTRKWLMSKLNVKKYGDKLELDGIPKNETSAETLALIAEKLNNNSNA